jgi:hypothetical protein
MAGYSKNSLIEGIKNCKKNIETFKAAIKKEHQTIEEYKFYIQKIDEHEKQQKILADANRG